MNTSTRRRTIRRGIAAAAIAMAALTATACGSDTPSAPSNIGDPIAERQPDPKTGDPDQKCFGSANSGSIACRGDAAAGSGQEPQTPRQADQEDYLP